VNTSITMVCTPEGGNRPIGDSTQTWRSGVRDRQSTKHAEEFGA